MNKIHAVMTAVIAIFTQPLFADTQATEKGILTNITEDNKDFVASRTKEDFEKMFDGQNPRVVVLGCADSRFHSNAIDKTPENDIFFVRNIGNQYANSCGSVMYAVRHLNVPVVLIIGHDSCGAVTAATAGYNKLEKDIQKEIKTMKLPIHTDKPTSEHIHQNVEANVCSQVSAVMKDFKKEMGEKKLDVLGAVYDFKNEYGQGYGALVFVNWNGERDHKVIAAKAQELGLSNMRIS